MRCSLLPPKGRSLADAEDVPPPDRVRHAAGDGTPPSPDVLARPRAVSALTRCLGRRAPLSRLAATSRWSAGSRRSVNVAHGSHEIFMKRCAHTAGPG